MSIRQQIPLLEALADVDERLRQVEEDLALRRGGLEAIRTELSGLEKKVASGRESIASMEKTRNDLHIEARQMSSQIEKSREKLGRSRNERESVAATRELEELRKLLRDREDEIQKIESLLERARAAWWSRRPATASSRRSSTVTRRGAALALAEREKLREELLVERQGPQKQLPPVLYRKYETIRKRRPRAIASTQNGTCNGCHIAVTPMKFQHMLRQEEFEQCPNCHRLLYYSPKQKPEGEDKAPGGGGA